MRETRLRPEIIGYRKNGRPIHLIQGGSAPDPAGGNPGGTGTGNDPSGTGADPGGNAGGTGAPGGSTPPSGTPGPYDGITDPVELRAIANRLQAEAAQAGGKSREQARAQAAAAAQQETLQKVAEALGLAPHANADPAELQRSIAQLTEQTQEKDRELAIYRAALAPGMNVNVGRLTDSRAFIRSMKDVDPNADDATAVITQKIRDALTSDPSLQAVQVRGGGSLEHSGGAGDPNKPDLSKLHGQDLMAGAYAATSNR